MAERERRPRVFKQRVNFNENPDYNRKRFRLTDAHIGDILNTIGPFIAHETDQNHALTTEQQIRISLRYLASGSLYSCVADSHGISKPTLSRTLHRFVDAVNDHLFARLVTMEDQQAIRSVVDQFRQVADMPCVISCVDGTHVDIKRPRNHEYQYVNRHGDHSLNVMVMCDRRLRFTYASSRWPGAVNDSRVWRNSAIGQAMADLDWNPYPNGIILGDSGYPNLKYLITPLLNPQTEQERQFNISHKKTRRLIECAIGVLKQRFRCLLGILPFEENFCARVVNCCIALHNICIGRDDGDADFNEDAIEQDNELDYYQVDERRAGNMRRNQLIALF